MEAHGWIFTARLRWSQGAESRVGRAIALALADAGADVAFSYNSSAEAAAATAAEIEAKAPGVAIRADQSQAAQVTALVDATVGQLGRLDVLVNSASLWRRTPWAGLDEAAWDQLLDINLKGPFLCARAAAPHLAAHGDGAIVNIVDLSAGVPFPNLMPHSAAKAGLWNRDPGAGDGVGAGGAGQHDRCPAPCCRRPSYTEKQIAATARRTLLGRWGCAEDVAQAAVFLAQAPYITGVLLPVDGGEHLGMYQK